MAYHHTALIGCLLLLVACLDQADIEIEQLENYVADLQTWQRDSRERLVESVALLTRTTHEYLDGRVSRTTWQHAWYQAHPRWLEAALLELDTSSEQIDAWPITPGFLDSLDDYPQTGIINDDSLDIASEVLRHQHQITDSTEVSLGFHVLEYYAFARPETDLQETDEASSRRRLFIRLVAEMLLLDVSEFAADLKEPQRPLLQMMQARSQAMMSEFNRIGEHGQFSGSSLTNIAVQLKSIRTMMREPVAFGNYLIELDTDLTEVFHTSLLEAIELVSGLSELDEANSSRLLLLLSALSHQLEDFVRLAEHHTDPMA